MIRSFRGLKTYRGERTEVPCSCKRSPAFPRAKRCSFTDQIRRSVRATKSMTAAAWSPPTISGGRREPIILCACGSNGNAVVAG